VSLAEKTEGIGSSGSAGGGAQQRGLGAGVRRDVVEERRRLGPRQPHLPHPVLGTLHARRPGVQIGLGAGSYPDGATPAPPCGRPVATPPRTPDTASVRPRRALPTRPPAAPSPPTPPGSPFTAMEPRARHVHHCPRGPRCRAMPAGGDEGHGGAQERGRQRPTAAIPLDLVTLEVVSSNYDENQREAL
jgi:hypothetical protein